MLLRQYGYREYVGSEREWLLEKSNFGLINLIVGQNAAGKSRVLNTMHGLTRLLTNKVPSIFNSGSYSADFLFDGKSYTYDVSMESRKVSEETLKIDGETVLQRDGQGRGFAWSSPLSTKLDFKVPADVLAVVSKRDEIQHPYLEPLERWAASSRRYNFGSEMGRLHIYAHQVDPAADSTTAEGAFPRSDDPDAVAKMYIAGWDAFGKKFDKEILSDLKRVGYDCVAIDARPDFELGIQLTVPPNTMPVMLSVQERDLKTRTWQHEMSMGMFRALALIIHMNYSLMTKQAACVMIDDIGEGLDFERSTNLIHLIIDRAASGEFQLFMTTNDRFVMNEVDLEHWHVINRTGSVVRMLDASNSREAFSDFRFMGLNNFDFFSSKMYLGLSDEKSSDLR